jgi:hypothetical protein
MNNATQQCIKIIAETAVKSKVVARCQVTSNLTVMKPAIGYIFLCETLEPIHFTMDKEQIFKESIAINLNLVLEKIGYSRTLEHKGLVEFTGTNNILTFVFEWNETHGFYCQLQFDGELEDYPLQFVMNRLKGIPDTSTPEFRGEFSELVKEWTKSLSRELPDLKISELTVKSEIIQGLRREFEQRDLEYNRNLELETIKKEADEAWNSQNFKQFIAILRNRVAELPDSYSKKLSIAKKRK